MFLHSKVILSTCADLTTTRTVVISPDYNIVYLGQCLSKKIEEKNLLAWFNYKSSMSVECVLTVLCLLCSLLSTRPQAQAGYPRVAPKPSLPCMATGGACHEDGGQGSPVMMKTVPVQSSRPHTASATMAHQG